MIDLARIRQDAAWVQENHNGSMAGVVAEWLLHFLDHPEKLIPVGYRIVREPELLGKGVNDRRAGA